MKCSKCPYLPERCEAGDYPDCPAPEEKWTTWKDGEDGCTLTRRQLDKMNEEYSDYLGNMGDDMGIQLDFNNKGWEMEKALDDMRHMIGLDMLKHKPYRRHGKLFYKPYRNHWAGFNKYLDYMSGVLGLVEKQEPKLLGGMPYYYLTRRGLDFLGRHIGVTIHNEED